MNVSLHKISIKIMLNRRILRLKAFKVLYGSVLSDNMSLSQAQSQLDVACEATRDLYVYMLGIVSPLTRLAQDRIDAAKAKFNPTEEELNPNTKFSLCSKNHCIISLVRSVPLVEAKKRNFCEASIFSV